MASPLELVAPESAPHTTDCGVPDADGPPFLPGVGLTRLPDIPEVAGLIE